MSSFDLGLAILVPVRASLLTEHSFFGLYFCDTLLFVKTAIRRFGGSMDLLFPVLRFPGHRTLRQ